MSLLDQASLVLVPSAIKTGEVLVQKPLPTKFSDETGNYDGNDPQGSANLTFTRNSNATRVNSDGKVERVRTNEITYSNAFTSGNWLGEFLSPTPATSGQTDKDGGTNAWLLTKATSSGSAYNSQVFTGVYTFSLYVKKETGKGIKIYNFGSVNPNVTINIGTGAIVSQSLATAQVEAYNANWWRVSMTATVSAGRFYIYITDGTATQISGTLTIQDAQAELSDFGATAYIPTTTSARSIFAGISLDGTSVPNVPRLDYSGGATCGKLLLEPQCTALLQYSEQLDNAAWTKNNATTTANAITSPDGYANADKVMASAGNAAHSVYQIYNGTTGTYTHSAFFKAGEYSYAFLRAGGVTGSPYVIYNLATQAAVSSAACTHKIEAYGSGWFRISLVPTNTSGLHATNVMFLPSSGYTLDTANVPSWNADGTSGGYVWGVNLTQTSYVQSYIPTLGASVTRLADSASRTNIANLIGQTEGTLFCDFNVLPSTLAGSYYLETILNDGTASNKISITYYASGRIQFVAFASGSLVVNIDLPSYGLTVGKHKFALAYKLNDYVAYVDGALVGSDTSAAVPAMSALNLYDTNGGTHAVNQTLLFKTRLSNATLANLTAL